MGSMICGKCESESTYYQGGGYACMMCGNRSPSRWGFHRKGEQIKPPEPMEEYQGPYLEEEEIEQEEEINMGKKRTPEQRERIAAGIRAAKARKKGGVPAEMPPEKVKMLKELKTHIRGRLVSRDSFADPFPDAKIEGQAVTPITPDPRHVILDFNLEENAHIYDALYMYSRRYRRFPPDQILALVEEIMKHEGLI